jgi:hypothetical protein
VSLQEQVPFLRLNVNNAYNHRMGEVDKVDQAGYSAAAAPLPAAAAAAR